MEREPKLFSISDINSWIEAFKVGPRGQNYGSFIEEETYQAFKDQIPSTGLNMDNVQPWAQEVAKGIIQKKRELGKPAPYIEELQEDLKRFLQEQMYAV